LGDEENVSRGSKRIDILFLTTLGEEEVIDEEDDSPRIRLK
jgi:hypothetical protein